jgi:sugar lactone lactonase YvrE
MHRRQVLAVDGAGSAEVIAEVGHQPSGLGWMPDGSMLVVSMTDRRVLRFQGEQQSEHADLASIATWHCNDMVVDAVGRAYVGNFGFDLHGHAAPRTAALALVGPDGRARVAARDLSFPNGMVIVPDGGPLIVAETLAGRLSVFEISADGSLSAGAVFADLEAATPDGICLDADGAIWVASPKTREVLRVADDGRITERVDTGRPAFDCMLGGPDRRTLFVATASTSYPDACQKRLDGRIEMLQVLTPGAGLP